jgi:hypothetical protein
MTKINLIIISLSILLNSNDDIKYFDNSPKKITHEDKQIMKEFDKLAYELVEEKHKVLSINKIYTFIKNNKSYIHDYNKILVNLNGALGSKTKRASEYNENITDERNYYNLSINLKYPFYDEKLKKELHNEKIKYNEFLLIMIKDYVLTNQTVIKLKQKLKFYRLKQIRGKLLQKTGIEYLSTRLEIMDNLLTTKDEVIENEIKLKGFKEQLLNLTSKPNELKKLL